MRKVKGLSFLFCLGLFWPTAVSLNAEVAADSLKTATAFRINTIINIDGILNETAWAKAMPISGFRQLEPFEGEPASESTTVKILYDDEAIYIGVWCFDREPEKIVKQLTRRDRWTESDQIAIRIDSYHDHQTAFYFGVNAAGVQRDILLYNNYCDDERWDAVWEADAKVENWGWSAEYRIPFSALRFSEAEEYTWGFDISRYIPRRNESSRWQFVPSSETRGVSRYGHLVAIKEIKPPGRVETLPYVVSYGVSEPDSPANNDGHDFFSNIGLDFKYGISSALTLDATINPDFGQIESDQAIINLTTFETFFEEKRPFFLEGSEIFATPFFNQFHSRRIGGPPTGGVDDVDFYIGYPRSTTILSALKLTGKTDKGTSIGAMNIITQEEKAKYKLQDDPHTYTAVVEPLASYSVTRIKQDILGNSYIGGAFTAANQKDRKDAFSGSVDWKLRFNKEMFDFTGIVLGTNNGPGTGDAAWAAQLNKNSGKIFRGSVSMDYYGREVNWNRLGYMQRNSYRGRSAWIQLYSNKVFSVFKQMSLNFNGWYNELLDGHRAQSGGNINSFVFFSNSWALWNGVGLDASRFDDRETRGNGLWHVGSNYRWWVGGCTNSAARVNLEINYHHDNERDGLFNLYNVWVNFRPVSNFEFSLGNEYYTNRGVDFWVGTGVDGYPVFANLDNDVADISFRGIYTFTKYLTLQWQSQIYFSAGEYDDYRRLLTASHLEKVDLDRYPVSLQNLDFNYKALTLNLILRWEYLPGSTLYIVWTQARDQYLTNYGDFRFSRDFNDLFSTPQTNTFLIKANYWWNI